MLLTGNRVFMAASFMAAASVVLTSPASAHVTIAQKQASVDSHYQAVLRVPHGCQGAATTAIRVRVPEGLIGVKPQPKPGWSLETVNGKYARAHTRHGAHVTEGVKEIIWSGGRLLDEHYDEFVFVGHLSSNLKPDTTVYFPVVQECEQGIARWIDIPTEGAKPASDHSDSPAPGLKLLPKQP